MTRTKSQEIQKQIEQAARNLNHSYKVDQINAAMKLWHIAEKHSTHTDKIVKILEAHKDNDEAQNRASLLKRKLDIDSKKTPSKSKTKTIKEPSAEEQIEHATNELNHHFYTNSNEATVTLGFLAQKYPDHRKAILKTLESSDNPYATQRADWIKNGFRSHWKIMLDNKAAATLSAKRNKTL